MRRAFLTSILVALVAAGGASAYPWPFKPFDRQHPIRGFFGDPRTVFENGVLAGGFDGPGFFSFHQGVDISAPNGTPVYPVVGGTAHYMGAATLNVDAGNGRVFQYFHIVPIVGEGQAVLARRTILGYVQPPFGHVHLTEVEDGRAVNPLQKGHLTPFRDRTKPTVREVIFRNATGTLQTPLGLCGRVQLAVDAYDTQPMPVPGKFRGLPLAPALVQWSVQKLGGPPAPWRTAADFRTTLPGNGRFTDVYAKGTYENSPRFGNQQYTSMPGRYLFLLAGSYDTTALANGAYVLDVRVADVRGNRAFYSDRFSVLNSKNGVCPGSLPAPPSTQPPSSEPPDASATP
ncbi:MAG TPA: M23 family metallopeptidase [Gaiellaceae bacterium]|nr:M23 family metallopeptidase [Gaiellaceae bacterium]